jgi:hypothetical protein
MSRLNYKIFAVLNFISMILLHRSVQFRTRNLCQHFSDISKKTFV